MLLGESASLRLGGPPRQLRQPVPLHLRLRLQPLHPPPAAQQVVKRALKLISRAILKKKMVNRLVNRLVNELVNRLFKRLVKRLVKPVKQLVNRADGMPARPGGSDDTPRLTTFVWWSNFDHFARWSNFDHFCLVVKL